MAKIIDPTDLNVGTELTINTGTKVITLNVAGNLVAKDGVTLQALYSKLEDLWTSSTYNNHPFPMYAIDFRSGQFYFGYDGVSYNGWVLANDTVRSYIRDAGWREYLSDGTLDREYFGVVSLGSLNSGAQPYYQKVAAGSATNFTYTDEVNEPVMVFEDGGIDNRALFKLYAREYGYRYADQDLTDLGESASGPFKLSFPLANSVDPNIQNNDAYVAANAPYTGITATWLVGNNFDTTNTSPYVVDDVVQDGAGRWYICTGNGTADSTDYANLGAMAGAGTATFSSYTGEREIDGDYYAFNIIVDGNAATKEQIHTKLQYLLRQSGDIDSGAGTHLGKVTDVLDTITAGVLTTTTGVYIDDTQTADSAFLVYTDVGGVERSIPVVTNQSVTVTGPVAGSRIQIYDLTSSTELYNGTPTFPYTWTDPSVYAADREIRLRVAYVNGTTAKKFIDQTIGTATETDFALSFLVDQENDQSYIDAAVDGSAVTDITIDDGLMLIEIDTANETVQNIYAYEMYYLFTSTGIQDLGQSISSADSANYIMDSTVLKLKNISGSKTAITGGFIRDTDGDPLSLIDDASDTLHIAPPHVVAYSASGGTESNYLNTETGDLLIPLS
jgi:hypothetical protein